MEAGLKRRDLISMFGAAAAFTTLQLPAAAHSLLQLAEGQPGAPLFFTKDEFACLDLLTELIVPTDDHSPGAHEAGVATFIDRSVAEAFLPEDKTSWRKGLAAINDLSQSMNGAPFLKTSKDQQTALLTKIAASEQDAKTEPERFFTQLKQTTAFAYYSSSIGIHQEINYLGNCILDKFVGYEAS
ncbi:MAG: gluconate 2-dehydrogenase subunit 3 family protein [Acidobacteriaceae bacterium]|nr:gluconate 2-dehydrogenase subunit 3 family protein [Acidobacteriaceae bacterium]